MVSQTACASATTVEKCALTLACRSSLFMVWCLFSVYAPRLRPTHSRWAAQWGWALHASTTSALHVPSSCHGLSTPHHWHAPGLASRLLLPASSSSHLALQINRSVQRSQVAPPPAEAWTCGSNSRLQSPAQLGPSVKSNQAPLAPQTRPSPLQWLVSEAQVGLNSLGEHATRL